MHHRYLRVYYNAVACDHGDHGETDRYNHAEVKWRRWSIVLGIMQGLEKCQISGLHLVIDIGVGNWHHQGNKHAHYEIHGV